MEKGQSRTCANAHARRQTDKYRHTQTQTQTHTHRHTHTQPLTVEGRGEHALRCNSSGARTHTLMVRQRVHFGDAGKATDV